VSGTDFQKVQKNYIFAMFFVILFSFSLVNFNAQLQVKSGFWIRVGHLLVKFLVFGMILSI